MRRRPRFQQKTSPPPAVSRKMRDGRRKSSGERGYDRAWQLYRERFIDEFPFCIACVTERTAVIDHIIPVRQDDSPVSGPADPLFWEPWNHQPLCRRHHRVKTDLHDFRLTHTRQSLLNQLSCEDPDERRQQLLILSEIWPQWVNLLTGEVCRLEG